MNRDPATEAKLPITGAVAPVPARSRRNWTEQDAEKARKMGSRVPEPLYRYVKLRDRSDKPSSRLREYLEAVVRDSKLYFSHYAGMNDPFEGSFSISVDAPRATKIAYWTEAGEEQGKSQGEIEAVIRGVLNPTPEQTRAFEKIVRDNFSTHGACCFTGRRDDLLAWSYYAGGHTGLCLRFRMKTLFRELGQAPGMLLKVQYKKNHPRERFYQPGQFNMMLAAFCTKARMWRHEREWRLVLPKLGRVPFPSDALDGIIMGCRITQDDEDFVRNLAAGRNPPIELLRARMKERKYAVEIVAA